MCLILEQGCKGGLLTTYFRINWTGSALTTFYAAVRKALVVVIIVRAVWVLLGLLCGGWLLFMR